MSKNKLIDLNDHLFAQMERLSDEDITGDKLIEEINRAKAVSGIASQIVANANLALEAAKFADDLGHKAESPTQLLDKLDDKEKRKCPNLFSTAIRR